MDKENQEKSQPHNAACLCFSTEQRKITRLNTIHQTSNRVEAFMSVCHKCEYSSNINISNIRGMFCPFGQDGLRETEKHEKKKIFQIKIKIIMQGINKYHNPTKK